MKISDYTYELMMKLVAKRRALMLEYYRVGGQLDDFLEAYDIRIDDSDKVDGFYSFRYPDISAAAISTAIYNKREKVNE